MPLGLRGCLQKLKWLKPTIGTGRFGHRRPEVLRVGGNATLKFRCDPEQADRSGWQGSHGKRRCRNTRPWLAILASGLRQELS